MPILNHINTDTNMQVDTLLHAKSVNQFKPSVLAENLTSTATITTMPIEIIRKIAYSISAIDYNRLKRVNKFFSQHLESIQEMDTMAKSNTLPKSLHPLFHKMVAERDFHINMRTIDKNMLKNVAIFESDLPPPSNTRKVTIIAADCEYTSDIHQLYLAWNQSTTEWNRLSNVFCLYSLHSLKKTTSNSLRFIIKFEHCKINLSSLDAIFQAADSMVNASYHNDNQKYYSASLMSRLKDHWRNHLPNNMTIDNLNEVTNHYKVSLALGDKINQLIG